MQLSFNKIIAVFTAEPRGTNDLHPKIGSGENPLLTHQLTGNTHDRWTGRVIVAPEARLLGFHPCSVILAAKHNVGRHMEAPYQSWHKPRRGVPPQYHSPEMPWRSRFRLIDGGIGCGIDDDMRLLRASNCLALEQSVRSMPLRSIYATLEPSGCQFVNTGQAAGLNPAAPRQTFDPRPTRHD